MATRSVCGIATIFASRHTATILPRQLCRRYLDDLLTWPCQGDAYGKWKVSGRIELWHEHISK